MYFSVGGDAMREGKITNSRRKVTSLRLVDSLVDHHFAGLGTTVRACLAVCGSMTLRGRTRPLSLILEGNSGSGKTVVIHLLMPKANPALADYVYRSDRFTPKAFVTHAANVSA